MSLNFPVTVREAQNSDTQTIIDLIQALAIYEKEPQAAKATPELIRENIFEKRYAHCLVAETEVDGRVKPVGIAIVSCRRSSVLLATSLVAGSL